MDLASRKIELSERYIQKLKCGHTLQSYNAVVLWRNNGIGTPSLTAAILSGCRVHRKILDPKQRGKQGSEQDFLVVLVFKPLLALSDWLRSH